MKKFIPILFLLFTQLYATDSAIYTLTGKKDPRIEAWYDVTYASNNLSKEACVYRLPGRKETSQRFLHKRIDVNDTNYAINLPLVMPVDEDKYGCSYQVVSFDLKLKRAQDEYISKFQIFGQSNVGSADYALDEKKLRVGNFVSYILPREKSRAFRTYKQYFRIAPKTTFSCMTENIVSEYEQKIGTNREDTRFMCVMDMKFEDEGGRGSDKECGFTPYNQNCNSIVSPDFGVDELKSEILNIDIVVDEARCKTTKIWAETNKITREPDKFREVTVAKSKSETVDYNATYTIYGKKDPRLEAGYSVKYIATNLKEGCGYSNYSTGTMKPSSIARSIGVPDGNYTINLPIFMKPEEDKEGCAYRFAGLDLMIRRPNAKHGFSEFPILGEYRFWNFYDTSERAEHWARPRYQGYDGSETTYNFTDIFKKDVPMSFRSNKKYFRIVPDTRFICMTQKSVNMYEESEEDKNRHEKYSEMGAFMCTIQMQLDTEGGKYHYKDCKTVEDREKDIKHECGTMTHPEFGVDEITSDTMHIDILVDESKCQKVKHWHRNDIVKPDIEPDIFWELPDTNVWHKVKKLF